MHISRRNFSLSETPSIWKYGSFESSSSSQRGRLHGCGAAAEGSAQTLVFLDKMILHSKMKRNGKIEA